MVLGGSYTDRLSDHRGFFQVTVKDPGPAPAESPQPRRAVLVVFDGLGHREAEEMPVLQELGRRGQCRLTDVGPLSVSRPVYAVLSTGLEQDRSGSRNNDCTAPLAAESVWQLARRAGMQVAGVSELPWWQQLFPDGFSTYRVRARQEDFFAAAPAPDLLLVHPIYIDESGHSFGAAARQYGAAVRRANDELSRFLAALDLGRDLLVVTADHGHSERGGHGGVQERIRRVLTCYAGRGVRRSGPGPRGRGSMRATSVGPSLSLLLGLPFPAQMRAGRDDRDDGLDVLFEIADPAAFPPRYLSERRQAVARFRAENRRFLGGGSWSGFYAHRRQQRHLLGLLLAAPIALVTALLLGHRRRRGDALFGGAWIAGVYLLSFGLQVLLRGGFDPTSINKRAVFIPFTFVLSLCIGGIAAAVHYLLRRAPAALLRDGAALVGATALLSAAHPLLYGWTLRCPLPRPEMIFFPYFAAIYLVSLAGLGLFLILVALGLRWRRVLG